MESKGCARVSEEEGSQLGPVHVSLSTLLSQVGTVIVSDLRHRIDTELAQSTFKLNCVWTHLSQEEGALRVKHWVPVESQWDRHPALPTGCHQGDCAATELQGEVVPAPIMYVKVKGHGAPGPQVDDRLAGEELQTQLQLMLLATDREEESMVHPVGTEAQHQR